MIKRGYKLKKWRMNIQTLLASDAIGNVSRRQRASVPYSGGLRLEHPQKRWALLNKLWGELSALSRLISQAEIWILIPRVVAPLTMCGNEVTAPNLRISMARILLRWYLRFWCPGSKRRRRCEGKSIVFEMRLNDREEFLGIFPCD